MDNCASGIAKLILVMLAKTFFTFTLSVLLGYVVLNLGPVHWVLDSEIGFKYHVSLLTKLGWDGIEDALDSLIIMSYSAMLPPSTWICSLLTRHLSVRKSRSNRT